MGFSGFILAISTEDRFSYQKKKRKKKAIVKSQNNFMLISSCTSYFNKTFNTVGRMTPLRSGVWTSQNLKGADFCQVLLDVLWFSQPLDDV